MKDRKIAAQKSVIQQSNQWIQVPSSTPNQASVGFDWITISFLALYGGLEALPGGCIEAEGVEDLALDGIMYKTGPESIRETTLG